MLTFHSQQSADPQGPQLGPMQYTANTSGFGLTSLVQKLTAS